jgi:hypothetical protein
MSKIVHIVIAGTDHPSRLLPLQTGQIALSKVYFVMGEKDTEQNRIAEKVIKDAQKLLGDIPSEIFAINFQSIGAALSDFIKVINKAKSEGDEIYINISSGPKLLTSAALIAAGLEDVKIYYVTPRERSTEKAITNMRSIMNERKPSSEEKLGRIKEELARFDDYIYHSAGADEIEYIPVFQIIKHDKRKMAVLVALHGLGSHVRSLEELVDYVVERGYLHGSRNSIRNTVSRTITELGIDGMVAKRRLGRESHIALTDKGKLLGEVYSTAM